MTIWLKQSTACTIMFGPFVDKTDGVTLKTDATTITDIDHATTGIFLSKNGGAAAIRHQAVTASVADAYGMMKVTLDTTDTGTLGSLDVLFAKAATYLPVHKSFEVIAANVYDSLIGGGDVLDVSAIQFAGQTITAAAGVTIPTSIASPTNITAGTITTVTNLTNAPTNGDLTATMKTSVTTAATAATPTATISSGTGAGQLSISSGVVASNMTQIDGQATSGNNATLKLKRLDIQNNAGTAITVKSTGGNGMGLEIYGDGTGNGIHAVSGNTGGHGIRVEALGSQGCGIKVEAENDAVAFISSGTPDIAGLYIEGGYGLQIFANSLGAIDIQANSGKSINAPNDIAVSDGDLTLANLQLISSGQITVKKNVALPDFAFVMTDTDGVPATGLTVAAERRIDSGSFAACANTPATELANGWYTIDLDASDLNGTSIALRFSAIGAADTNFTIITQD